MHGSVQPSLSQLQQGPSQREDSNGTELSGRLEDWIGRGSRYADESAAVCSRAPLHTTVSHRRQERGGPRTGSRAGDDLPQAVRWRANVTGFFKPEGNEYI